MIESMRAHGYSFATAIADLIDNSIAAGCGNVWIRFEWDAGRPWVAVVDDGLGMDETTLVKAMRLGSRSPLESREPSDLGRYGLGLKTASFSQARRLTVITRRDVGSTHLRRWDLDHLERPEVKGWQLLRSPHETTGPRADMLDELDLENGTEVLLEVLDRLVVGAHDDGTGEEEDHFLWHIEQVKPHLGMVFHRFLSRRKDPIRISLNDEQIQSWDPFLEAHPATQQLGDYEMSLSGHSTPVRVTAFVLPHRDRFESTERHLAAGGHGGWNLHQGFYVYRADRLIIAGGWLELGWQQEDHYKLARLRLDLPNTMDIDWQIDVKKSTASPPPLVRAWLKSIAKEVRGHAKEVYGHRGRYGPRPRATRLQRRPWVPYTKSGGEFGYRIDRQHPVLCPFISDLSRANRQGLEVLLRLIEETVPVQRIWIDTAENPEGPSLPFAHSKGGELRWIIEQCIASLMNLEEMTRNEALVHLTQFDGFQGDEAQAILAEMTEGHSE